MSRCIHRKQPVVFTDTFEERFDIQITIESVKCIPVPQDGIDMRKEIDESERTPLGTVFKEGLIRKKVPLGSSSTSERWIHLSYHKVGNKMVKNAFGGSYLDCYDILL